MTASIPAPPLATVQGLSWLFQAILGLCQKSWAAFSRKFCFINDTIFIVLYVCVIISLIKTNFGVGVHHLFEDWLQ